MTMKNVSKLALFVAAGMVSAGVQAADFEVDDRTTVTLGGEVVLNYITEDATDGSDETQFTDDGSIVVFGGSRDLGNGVTGYIETEFEYNTLGDGDGDFTRDATVLGFAGDFGEIQIGDSDNVFEDLISDSVDPFENATLAQVDLTDEDNMVTYYSPDMGNFSFRLQSRIADETTTANQTGTELSLIAAAQFTAGNLSLRAAYDDRGSVDAETGNAFESEDEVLGVAAVFGLTDAVELSARYAEQSGKDGIDSDGTAVAINYDYGMGSLYGAFQDVSVDAGEDGSQMAFGANYDVADGLMIFAEYGDFDDVDGDDSLAVAGLVFEY
ncbi:MAG: porin [Spiribacter salinus]|uniref:Porin n=1 Tax=Spiribacter salinus TaxID=1335746 RepID=A0A540VS81_9GAMM|nr:MAG: porin [Spiribacter salinus]